MRRGTLAFLMVAILGISVFAQICFASKNPDTIEINHVKDKKGAVKFEHKKHNTDRKIECTACHHKSEKGKDITDGCAKCHGKAKDGDKPSAKDAYHKNCNKDCHDKEKKGPTKCDGCHGK